MSVSASRIVKKFIIVYPTQQGDFSSSAEFDTFDAACAAVANIVDTQTLAGPIYVGEAFKILEA